jgi:hypothetical protein
VYVSWSSLSTYGGDSGNRIFVLYWRCSLIRVSVIRGSTVHTLPAHAMYWRISLDSHNSNFPEKIKRYLFLPDIQCFLWDSNLMLYILRTKCLHWAEGDKASAKFQFSEQSQWGWCLSKESFEYHSSLIWGRYCVIELKIFFDFGNSTHPLSAGS